MKKPSCKKAAAEAKLLRRLPGVPSDVLLSQGEAPTTIGARELNFRVRDGNGCGLSAIITGPVF